ncbi:FG-GAP-like repeat-containing protein [Actinocorallia aurea]
MRPASLVVAVTTTAALLTALPAPASAASLAAPYDFDGNGSPDLVLLGPEAKTGGPPRPVVIRYAKTGRTQVLRGIALPTVASADFDTDGYADLAVTDPAADGIRVHHGSRKGLAEDADLLLAEWSGASQLDSGDVDGDGRPDLVFFYGSGFGVFRGAAPGQAPAVVRVDHRAVQPEIADFTGDGIDDIVLTSFGRWTPALFAGSPDGPTAPVALTELAQNRLTLAADVNGDGREDLLTRVRGTLRVSLRRATGFKKPQLLKGSTPGVPGGAWGSNSFFAKGDINGDGRDDVVIGDRLSGQVRVLYGARKGLTTQGAQMFTRKSVGAGPQRWPGFGEVVSLLNLSGDRKPELVVGSPGERAGRAYILRNSKGRITTRGVTRLTLKSLGFTGSGLAVVPRP